MPRFFVMTAPSGTGKTTLARRLLRANKNIKYSVSFTTRTMRPGEVEGLDYFFVGQERFKSMIDSMEFLEWVQTFGYYYGTAKLWVQDQLDAGFDILMDIDVVGARQVKANRPDAVFIFVIPPSYSELTRRLEDRGTESSEQVKLRLDQVRAEVNEIGMFDYLVVNDSLDRAHQDLEAIVRAGRLNLPREEKALMELLKELR